MSDLCFGTANMQEWWFDGVLGLKSVYLWCFNGFPLFSKFSLIFMIMQILAMG